MLKQRCRRSTRPLSHDNDDDAEDARIAGYGIDSLSECSTHTRYAPRKTFPAASREEPLGAELFPRMRLGRAREEKGLEGRDVRALCPEMQLRIDIAMIKCPFLVDTKEAFSNLHFSQREMFPRSRHRHHHVPKCEPHPRKGLA